MAPLPYRILLVEDNPADARLMREALKSSRSNFEIELIADGEAALERIHGCAGTEVPDLILLDLNLPKVGGHEILSAVRSHAPTTLVPVIVMSSSNARADIERAYELHANCYVRKPGGLDELFQTVGVIDRVWLNRTSLPNSLPRA